MPRKGDHALPADRERLRHMLQAARDVEFFAKGRSRADLGVDRMFTRAVLHAVQEIGEAAARVSAVGRAQAPALPWGSIVQMRHILVHAYFNVNYDYVWRVIEVDLEPLIAEMELMLEAWPDQ